MTVLALVQHVQKYRVFEKLAEFRSDRGINMGNGLSNIVAAAIVALAIIYTGGFGNRSDSGTDQQYEEWLTRAVGDIRTDVVVNCGCCGDEGPGRAASNSF